MPGPDFSAVTDVPAFGRVVGALLTVGLIVSALLIVACAVTWALATAGGSWHVAGKAKIGIFVAVGGAALTGSALAWADWLLRLGASL